MKNSKINVKQMTTVALMTAIMCILAPFSLQFPFSPVPITLGSMVICFSAYVLGMKWGTVSYLLYLLIGLVGVPVFSNFSSGPAKLLGPTGGYLIGFIFMALICGFFIDRFHQNRLLSLLGMVLGSLACYLFGSAWLAYQASMTFPAALGVGVLPFIPGDLVKVILALLIGPEIRKALVRANLFPAREA